MNFGSGDDTFNYAVTSGTMNGWIDMNAGNNTLIIDDAFAPTLMSSNNAAIAGSGTDTFTIGINGVVTGGSTTAGIDTGDGNDVLNMVGIVNGGVNMGIGDDTINFNLDTGTSGVQTGGSTYATATLAVPITGTLDS